MTKGRAALPLSSRYQGMDRAARKEPWYPTSREKRARCGAPKVRGGDRGGVDTSRLQSKDLVWRQEKWWPDSRDIRQRQDLFGEFDAQHIGHKLPPLLTASVAIRESVLQLLPQIF